MFFKTFTFIGCLLVFLSCNKNDGNEGPFIPKGTTVFTAVEIAFVPYVSGDLLFKKEPGFVNEITLKFKERIATENNFAWDQTFYQLGDDANLVIEFRLRYLETANSIDKTLAIYMPYWDDAGVIRSSIFELPITEVGIEEGPLAEKVEFHDTIELFGTEWINVFEVDPLFETAAEEDNPENFSKIYYSAAHGLIEMEQKSGSSWMLMP